MNEWSILCKELKLFVDDLEEIEVTSIVHALTNGTCGESSSF
jgi:hypothetical protein